MVQPVSLVQTAKAMEELVNHGTAHGKLAFWNACLSARNRLERNVEQALIMREYVNRPLPLDRDVLKSRLKPILGRTLDALYEIERLWNAGIIHFNTGTTIEEQEAWRVSMSSVIPGMGYKTVSFALHIYAPNTCHLLTIDCWHIRRLGEMYGPISPKTYVAYEKRLRLDIQELQWQEGGNYPPIVYAACLWQRERQVHSQQGEDYPSHAGLSCYVD
jgi:hypothetical protein